MFYDNSECSFLLELVSVIVYVAVPAVLDNRLYVSEMKHASLMTLLDKLFVRNCSSSITSVRLFIMSV